MTRTMSTAAQLYRRYKLLSDDIFDPIPNDVEEIARARRKALRCAELREKFTERYVPEEVRDENHEKVVDYLIEKALQCQDILGSSKHQVKAKPTLASTFKYIDCNQTAQKSIDNNGCTRPRPNRKRKSRHSLSPSKSDEDDEDIFEILSSLKEFDDIHSDDDDDDHNNHRGKTWFPSLRDKKFFFGQWRFYADLLDLTIDYYEKLAKACRRNKFNFEDHVLWDMSYTLAADITECRTTASRVQRLLRSPAEIIRFGFFIIRSMEDEDTPLFIRNVLDNLTDLSEVLGYEKELEDLLQRMVYVEENI